MYAISTANRAEKLPYPNHSVNDTPQNMGTTPGLLAISPLKSAKSPGSHKCEPGRSRGIPAPESSNEIESGHTKNPISTINDTDPPESVISPSRSVMRPTINVIRRTLNVTRTKPVRPYRTCSICVQAPLPTCPLGLNDGESVRMYSV